MAVNPLDTGDLFMFEMRRSYVMRRDLMSGPKYFLKCEIHKEVHDMFMAATTAKSVSVLAVGMVLELQGRVSEQNAPLKGGEVSVRKVRY